MSLSALAREFECSRETVKKKLARAGYLPVVSPLQIVQTDLLGPVDEKTDAAILYRLRDAIKAFMSDPDAGDPSRMNPLQRKQFWEAQRQQLAFEESAGNLITKIEVEEEQARIAKIIVHALETLPDVLERDCGLSGTQLVKVEATIDLVRDAMYSQMIAHDESPTASPASDDKPPEASPA